MAHRKKSSESGCGTILLLPLAFLLQQHPVISYIVIVAIIVLLARWLLNRSDSESDSHAQESYVQNSYVENNYAQYSDIGCGIEIYATENGKRVYPEYRQPTYQEKMRRKHAETIDGHYYLNKEIERRYSAARQVRARDDSPEMQEIIELCQEDIRKYAER